MFNNLVVPRREYSLSSLERQNLKAPTSVVFQGLVLIAVVFLALALRTQLFKKLFAGYFNELAPITSVSSRGSYYRCCLWRRDVRDRSVIWSYVLFAGSCGVPALTARMSVSPDGLAG
jgi:hypothetical protein